MTPLRKNTSIAVEKKRVMLDEIQNFQKRFRIFFFHNRAFPIFYA